MKRSNLYLIGACILALGALGCCKHFVSQSTCGIKEKKPVAPVVEVAAPVVKEVVAPVVDVVAPAVEAAAPVLKEVAAPAVVSYSFGDHRSSTLTTKAWQALADKNTEAVLVYTNKCIDMYGPAAAKMQAGLTEYPSGEAQNVFSYWAVNDIATSLYIQGEAYRKAKEIDKAKAAYQRVINEFSYGQAYDPGSKTFWKPAEAAADALYMIDKGLDLDYGNMTSSTLVQRMWVSLASEDLEEVIAYNMKLARLYSGVAKDMQRTLKDYPQLPAENIHTYWALNDVATGEFIVGEAYRLKGKNEEALAAYKKVIADYWYGQCWDTNGWFWKPAEAAQQKIMELEVVAEAQK
jgi:tetratricopeptide (TPR) repeat protein